jgi:hypothetical protein
MTVGSDPKMLGTIVQISETHTKINIFLDNIFLKSEGCIRNFYIGIRSILMPTEITVYNLILGAEAPSSCFRRLFYWPGLLGKRRKGPDDLLANAMFQMLIF